MKNLDPDLDPDPDWASKQQEFEDQTREGKLCRSRIARPLPLTRTCTYWCTVYLHISLFTLQGDNIRRACLVLLLLLSSLCYSARLYLSKPWSIIN